MNVPIATYRLQFSPSFTFENAADVLGYLKALGISHVYSSPVFDARLGSSHGYDIVDHNRFRAELGSRRSFEDLIERLKEHGMGWIQDIVPNHVAYTIQNKRLSNVMERGKRSPYRDFFDIDWNHSEELRGKVLAPFLRAPYEDCLRKGEIQLSYRDGLKIGHFGFELPVSLNSYRRVLGLAGSRSDPIPHEDSALSQLRKIFEDIEQAYGSSNHELRAREALGELYRAQHRVREFVEGCVARFNKDQALLDALMRTQNFSLSHWKCANEKINYRRFFDISDLVCLRIEDEQVFKHTHRLVFELLAKDAICGLRIDHVDGLADPAKYLKRLREKSGKAFLVVEKILMPGEMLPDDWPVEGSTGYDFLNYVNGILVARNNEQLLDVLYAHFTGHGESLDETLQKCKAHVIETHFGGEVDNLTRLFQRSLLKRPYGKNCEFRELREAMVQLLICLDVYRTYLSEHSFGDSDVERISRALSDASARRPELAHELKALRRLLEDAKSSAEALRCFMRWQQYTGSVMAKGLEDTALYVYSRLLSLNEVGSCPAVFGRSTAEFHEFNEMRQRRWPFSMNATSTHDTKRGEDVRARLCVLSEIPSEWQSNVAKWARLNAERKASVRNRPVPNSNEEYYAYQTLVGSYPLLQPELFEYEDRIRTHMVKALREAKVNSCWLEPNLQYEEAVSSFLDDLLASREHEFARDFLRFHKKISWYGVFNSLSQVLLKIASPGIPDFYQGTELWDLNLVDPDNRRPVDFQKRQRFLKELKQVQGQGPNASEKLLENSEDGKVKMFVVFKCLEARRRKRELFERGDYLALTIEGACSENLIAFSRRWRGEWAVTIAPRLLTNVAGVGVEPMGGNVWKDTHIHLPSNAPDSWEDIFTGRSIHAKSAGGSAFRVGEVLRSLPVALLLGHR